MLRVYKVSPESEDLEKKYTHTHTYISETVNNISNSEVYVINSKQILKGHIAYKNKCNKIFSLKTS